MVLMRLRVGKGPHHRRKAGRGGNDVVARTTCARWGSPCYPFLPVEPLKKYRKSGLEHFIKFVPDLPVLSPKAIFARLEELGYRGQPEARRAVSLMAYRHVRRIRRIYLDGTKREQLLPKTNTLLIGPTGCGKTHLVELLFR